LPKKTIAGALAALLLFAQACGGNDDEPASRIAPVDVQVKRYYSALASGNGEAACEVLTKKAAGGFEAVLNGPVSSECRANIEALSEISALRGRPRVTRVTVTGRQATAHVSFENPPLETDVVLVRENDAWKLAQLPAVLQSSPGGGFPEHSDQ
jgi:hypothetical protein